MPPSLDIAILGWAGISFAVFILLQLIVLRIVHPDAVLRWIVNIFIFVSIGHITGLAFVFHYFSIEYPGGLIAMAAVSYFVFGLYGTCRSLLNKAGSGLSCANIFSMRKRPLTAD